MKEKKMAIIGVGGRTGTMFAFELRKHASVLGVGKEIEYIKKEKLFIKRKGSDPELFEGEVITPLEFPSEVLPEIIFLTTKNPVGPVVKNYYQKIKESKMFPPTLILSQNGVVAGEDAINVLKEVFGKNYKKIRVVRLNLFNPIDKREINNKTHIAYSLPIKLVFGKISGPGNLQDIALLFKKAGIVAKEFPSEKVKNMEFSKLFLNLIGMASATRGVSVNQGFGDSEIFREEIGVLKEYIKVVRAPGKSFVNFPHFPVKLFAFLFEIFPIEIFLPFRRFFAKLISEGREGKPKDLGEIEYYNGAVVNLGKKIRIPTPVNEKVLKRVLK